MPNTEARTGYLLVLPLLVVTLGLLGYPLLNAVLLSLQNKSLGLPGVFIGLDNYRKFVLEDPNFIRIVRNTMVYTLGSVFGKTVVGLGMALILNENIKGQTFFRGLLMLPWLVPAAVTALNWKWILHLTGVLNYILVNLLGLAEAPIPWLARPNMAMLSLVMVNIWANFPFFGVNFLAAMQTIPTDLYEAAEVDGASAWQRFVHITLPGLRQMLLVLGILSSIWTWNQFTHIWLITSGGPAGNTHTFTTFSYVTGLTGQMMGYAAAISLAFVPVLMLAVGILSPLLLKSRE